MKRSDAIYEIQAHDCELKALLKSMEKNIAPCREMSIVKTKLEEASMWLCKMRERIEEWENGKK